MEPFFAVAVASVLAGGGEGRGRRGEEGRVTREKKNVGNEAGG